MEFRVGQKVECINDIDQIEYADVVRTGEVYEVSGLYYRLGELGLILRGLDRGSPWHGKGWASRRFRPIVERKTDISIFEKMLTGNRVVA